MLNSPYEGFFTPQPPSAAVRGRIAVDAAPPCRKKEPRCVVCKLQPACLSVAVPGRSGIRLLLPPPEAVSGRSKPASALLLVLCGSESSSGPSRIEASTVSLEDSRIVFMKVSSDALVVPIDWCWCCLRTEAAFPPKISNQSPTSNPFNAGSVASLSRCWSWIHGQGCFCCPDVCDLDLPAVTTLRGFWLGPHASFSGPRFVHVVR
mmetsp:Transcript_51304/g.104368  ORF Transcript_51304/g.104368 Transcript_51304/m.104368 type:complete len:206 (-) Transcript_51304:684-1301(-)